MHFAPSRIATPTAFLAVILAAASAFAQGKSSDLPAAIASQMDAASAKFTSAQADLRQELFTKVVNDTQTQAGQIYFLRKGTSTQMGMKLLPADAAAGAQPAQVVEFKDAKLRLFNPGINQVDERSASGKNQQLAETFMTLGFGGRSSDLEKSWIVTDQGAQTIAGTKAEKLDLVSRDQGIQNNFTHITIWVDPARDVSLKQVFFEASNGKATGDTRTVYFTNIRLNQSVDVKPFAIACKGKCTVVTH